MKDIEEILIGKSIEFAHEQIVSIFKNSKDLTGEAFQRLLEKTKLAFKNYFTTTIKKYSRTKTILYRTTPRYLYDFYIHLDLVDHTDHITSSENYQNLLLKGEKILITGIAGSGKSTLMKHFFINSIEQKSHIPVFIELRNINNTSLSFHNFIAESLRELNFKYEDDSFRRLLDKGVFLFLFDGFDEIETSSRNPISKQLIKFTDRFHKNKFIVSSRPDDKYISWSNFTELQVLPMNRNQCIELITKIDYDTELKENFLKQLKKNLFDQHESFLSNPLLSTIMLMTFEQFGNIPNKLHIFYYQAFDTLFNKHDATKAGFKRVMASELDINQFKEVLASFCIITYLNNQFFFNEDEILKLISQSKSITNLDYNFNENNYLNDLLRNVCILIQDGFRLSFTHRSFQEYFSAIYLSNTDRDRRQLLFSLLKERINVDNTFFMAYELNKNDFETDFLIPELEEIEIKTNFEINNLPQSLYNYLDFQMESVQISMESLIFKSKKEKEDIPQLLMFVFNLLPKIKKDFAPNQQKLIDGILKEVLLSTGLIKKEWGSKKVSEYISSRKGFNFKIKDLNQNLTLNLLLTLDHPSISFYINAMLNLQNIRTGQKNRAENIQKLFFDL